MEHADSYIINISIAAIHRLTSSILDIKNAFQNTNVVIHEIFCVIPPTYYLDWFQTSYPNVTLNRDYGPFFLQCINGIQVTQQDVRQWNRLLDAVVTIIKYKKRKIYHAIWIKFSTDGTVSYLTVSTDDFLNTTNNET